ncbi:MAG: biotin synthase BioB [Cellulosilyticaceae bacterium]
MNELNKLKEKILEGYQITKEEAIALVKYNQEDLSYYANEIREKLCGNSFDMCSIINGKSGACPENCKYCAQSAHYNTNIETYQMISKEKALEEAEENSREGVLRYSIVTAGRKLSALERDEVCTLYAHVNEHSNIKLCASHGLLDYEDLVALKKVGVTRYHNNLETSRNYFPQICTTHTYEDKIATIEAAKKAGLSICSGGIFGLGESIEERIDMAYDLLELGVNSIPVNVLVPIEGTPLGTIEPITEEEVLKTIAIYRFIHPAAAIRLAGGRSNLSEAGKKAFLGGANAAISGNMLTTCGNTIKEDMKLLEECQFEVKPL